jgi:hypothetical protein
MENGFVKAFLRRGCEIAPYVMIHRHYMVRVETMGTQVALSLTGDRLETLTLGFLLDRCIVFFLDFMLLLLLIA